MAEKLFSLGEGIRVRKSEVVDHTWSFDLRFPSKIASSGSFRTIGDLEESVGLEFFFSNGLSHQWFSETPDGHFLNSYTSLESDTPLAMFGSFSTGVDAECELKGEGDSFYLRYGTSSTDLIPVEDDLAGKTRKFSVSVGTHLSQSYLSYTNILVDNLLSIYPKAVPQSVSFRNNDAYTPGGVLDGKDLVCSWMSEPQDGLLKAYLKTRPLGLPELASANRTLLLRSDTTDFDTSIVDGGDYGSVPHSIKDLGNSSHRQVDSLLGQSSLLVSGLEFYHSTDFDLVGRQFDVGFNALINPKAQNIWMEKKGSYRLGMKGMGNKFFMYFDAMKDPSSPENLWCESHSNNSSQFLQIPYSSYFLNGLNQGAEVPYTLQFVASPGADSDQPIFRQAPLLGNDGDVHVLIDKVGGLKWKNGASGAVTESVGGVGLNPDQFYHFAIVFDGTNTRAYVDGQLVNTSTDHVTIADLDAIEIGRCFMGENNDSEVYMTSARLAWLSLDKGIAKWVGSFNPPTEPTIETYTSVIINVNDPSGAITDSTPHSHPVSAVNGGLNVEGDFVNILSGQLPDNAVNNWGEVRFVRTPGESSGILYNGKDITTMIQDPITWANSEESLILIPNTESGQLFEDIAMIVDGYGKLDSPLMSISAPSKRQNLSDLTLFNTVEDISSELAAVNLTASSEDDTNILTNVLDMDPNTFWESESTIDAVNKSLQRSTIQIEVPEGDRIDINKVDLTVSGLDPLRHPSRVAIRGVREGMTQVFADESGLTWTGNKEEFMLSPKAPVAMQGDMGSRVHPVVGRYIDAEGQEHLTVIAGTPANHYGKLNLGTSKWDVNVDNIHNRIGARGIYYTKTSMQQVMGIWSGDTSNNDYYELDAGTGLPTLVTTNGTPPTGKIHYCSGHYVDGSGDNKLIIFGGFDGTSYTSGVHELDLETMTWTTLTPSGSAPLVRAQATSAMYENGSGEACMLVFGGTNGTTWYNDVYELNLATTTWSQITTSGTPPIARETSPSNIIYKDAAGHNIFVIYGGHNSGNEFNDYNEFDVESGAWSGEIALSGNNPPGCRGSEGIIYKDENQDLCLVLVGGNNDSGYYNDNSGYCFYHPVLNLTQHQWKTKTPVATDCPCNSETHQVMFEGQNYLMWAHKGRYLYGLELATGSFYKFNMDVHFQAWNTNYVDEFAIAIGDNKIGIYGGFVGGSTSVPTRNFFEVSLTDMTVTPVSMSGELHTPVRNPLMSYFKDSEGNEFKLIYGGRTDTGDPVTLFTLMDDLGACTAQMIDPASGELSPDLFYNSLSYNENGIAHMFLYGQLESGVKYADINLNTMTCSSGFITAPDGSMITISDKGTLLDDGIFFFDTAAIPQTFRKLTFNDYVLGEWTVTSNILPSNLFRVASADNIVRFLSMESSAEFYYELDDIELVMNMQNSRTDTIHEQLFIDLYSANDTVEVSELNIFTENKIYPHMRVNPASDTVQDFSIATHVLHSDLLSTGYSPAHCGISDPDGSINNIGSAFIASQDRDGLIVIDNTGQPSRKALVKVDVTAWGGVSAFEIQDSDTTVIKYGFIQLNQSISSTPTDDILFWIDLDGNAITTLVVMPDAATEFLADADVYEASTYNGSSEDWFIKLESLSYLPACTVVNGGIEDTIIIDDTLQTEINFVGNESPNFVALNMVTELEGDIIVEEHNGTDWIVIGYLYKTMDSFVCGRVFSNEPCQKFRISVPAEFETEEISGLNLYRIENGSVSIDSQLIKTAKKKMWEVQSSTIEEILEYDQNLPCIVTGTVTTQNSPDMHLSVLPVKGVLLNIADISTPMAYPYSAMITTGDKTRIDADVSEISKVAVQGTPDVRVAFSFDDRVTWVAWTGSWTVVNASTAAQLNGTGMSPLDVSQIPSSAWTPNLGTGATIDVAVSMHVAAPTSTSFYDNVTFTVKDAKSNIKFMTYGLNKQYTAELEDSKLSIRDEAGITADDAYIDLRCGNVESGVNEENLMSWVPPDDGFLTKIVGTSFDQNPGWIYLSPGRPPVYPFIGQGWLNDRQTVRKVDIASSTIFTVVDDIYDGNSEGGISFSNGQTGYIFGIDERSSSKGFFKKMDFATGTISTNIEDMDPLHSRGCCVDTVKSITPPMDGSIFFRSVDFASETKVNETRINGKSVGWTDQGSLSRNTIGYFFNGDAGLSMSAYNFNSSTEEISDRQDFSGLSEVKGFTIPSLDQGHMIASSAVAGDRLRSITIEYTNDTTYVEVNTLIPVMSGAYNSSVTDRDSVHSRVGDNDRALMYIYNNGTSVCLEMDFSVKLFTTSSRLESEIAAGKEGYKAAGMSGLGYII